MSLFGVELNHKINKIIIDIRLTLQKQKLVPNLRTIYRSIYRFDQELSGSISSQNLQKAFNQNGIYFKIVDLQVISKAFDSGNGLVNWFQFLKAIRVPLDLKRKGLLHQIYSFLTQNNEKLSPQSLRNKFNFSVVQQIKTGKIKQQIMETQLIGLFSISQNHINQEEFISFYNDLNLNYPSDQTFFKNISNQWNYTLKRDKQPNQQQIKQAVRALRFKLIQKSQGTQDQFLLRKLFNEYDQNKNGYISEYQLDLMLKRLQLPVKTNLLQPLLIALDKNNSGFIQYDQFKKFIFFEPYPI